MRFGPILAIVLALGACTDKGKQSAEAARPNVESLVDLANKDVAEIERGLPEGGKKMSEILASTEDPRQNPGGVRNALNKIRRDVPDLGLAKSTFFAFTDDKGVAIRNNLEQDTMAGKDVVHGYPGLDKVLGGEPYVRANGQFGTPNPIGPDKEWVAAVPVKRADASLEGVLVTGWTYRWFAYHLQETLRRDVQDALLRNGETGKMPIVYVLLFDKAAVYGARGTPPIHEKTLGELDLVSKTASGTADGSATIDGRAFGWAAARVPKLGPETGIVVVRSEI
ncbi:MAG TPA: hypothetical protein VIF62_29505 [Labilithrix sp.]|jgi:hypothetical protein